MTIGFTKTQCNPARTGNPTNGLTWSHTLELSRLINDTATNNQVCFHWHHFCDLSCKLVIVHYGVYSASGCTNKATLGIKLLPVTILARQENCGCFLFVYFSDHLMAAFLFPIYVWCNLPSDSHSPHPTSSCLPAHLLYTESMILVRLGKIKCLKIQRYWLASKDSYENISYKTTYTVNLVSMQCVN